jgi:hypothetical protein
LRREPQRLAPFDPGDPASGYYNDLTAKPRAFGSPAAALRALAETPESGLVPVTVAQLGLGAWQLGWTEVAEAAADRLEAHADADGLLPHRFRFAHTYPLDPPWHSAMAQGEAASLFVRVRRPGAARRAVASLLDPASPLVAETPEGPVLQEYPTDPPSHVLNGWIFALWGLYDAGGEGTAERDAFVLGVRALEARLPRYRLLLDWSRYDLYPRHPLVHAASPFYHRLHVAQLEATNRLFPSDVFAEQAGRWRAAGFTSRGIALARKAAFRILRPRRAA